MNYILRSIVVLVAVCSFGLLRASIEEQQLRVATRMIGHELLLHSGDSTSRVLPVEHANGRYKISFAEPFHFDASALVFVVDNVVRKTEVAQRYLVEVEDQETGEIVYGFEGSLNEQEAVVPCRSREAVSSYYQLWFTVLEPGTVPLENGLMAGTQEKSTTNRSMLVLLLPASLLVGASLYLWRRKNSRPDQEPVATIGGFQFDRRNMVLSMDNERIELTGKEVDLLHLLNSSANHTVEREVILHEVWGDEGDYVGRTLDVFISKLRKKLETDPNVRIANIRGVGYRLVVG